MASRARSKGNYHENFFVKLFKAWKIKAKKQPLSGSLGGEYRGDLILTINGEDIITEVKYRKGTTFPSPFTVLEGRDAAIYKRGTGTDPKWIMILPDATVERIWRSRNDKGNRTED
tara:strand:+ start:368 stop:715 length:348 start_codon:yes stop_codon:yes gene_type:complete